ncbi:MAG: hypothetical protein NVS3B12_05120 [Acidimicrobiales bacterium]
MVDVVPASGVRPDTGSQFLSVRLTERLDELGPRPSSGTVADSSTTPWRRVPTGITPLYRILVGAAASDPDAPELLAEYNGQRKDGQRYIARSLAWDGALRHSIREGDAADIIYALASPEAYHLLTVDRGWIPERYERWLRRHPR